MLSNDRGGWTSPVASHATRSLNNPRGLRLNPRLSSSHRNEYGGEPMLGVVVPILLVGALVLGPLVWRLWRDRREERALAVRAAVEAAMRRALRGESLVALDVKAPMAFRSGRVILSVPAPWEWLIRQAWTSVIENVPPDYELVVRTTGRALTPTATPADTLPRAA
jgi:hypothetical protein